MDKPILILQHFWCETPGVFLDVLNERGILVETVRRFMAVAVFPAYLRGVRVARRYLLAAT
jgi:hypothetical protein